MKILLSERKLELLTEKGLLIDKKTLILGDLHFGKINHFRKAGLPVPFGANKKNAETLVGLLTRLRPEKTIFLGDLFHSHYNDEWETVGEIVRHFSACEFILVRGNHDIMSARQYERSQIKVMDHFDLGPFHLTHEPLDPSRVPEHKINIAGHLHPGAHLMGKGRQGLTLPCFWLTSRHLILPAFGTFTGLAAVHPEENDRVFLILENKIMEANLEGKPKTV